MKVVINRSQLLTIISKIQSIVSNKPALPILANVLLEAIDGQLILSATDLTTSMKCNLSATVIEAGAIAVPAKYFFSLVRELTSPQIKISRMKNESIEIVSGASNFKIHGVNKNEFPTISNISSNVKIMIESNKLKEMFSKTIFAVSTDEEDSMHGINGLYMKIESQIMTLIGTDGKIIAKIVLNIDVEDSFKQECVLPIKAADEIIKILDDKTNIATLSIIDGKMFIEYENNILITNLLATNYPSVENVIPENKEEESVVIHREELIALLRQVSLFTNDDNNSVKFTFTKGCLELKVMNSNVGEGIVQMPVDYIFEKKLDIAFNPRYFQQMLKHSKDETIKFFIKDSYNPVVIKDTTSAIFVMMPMRLQEEKDIKLDDSKEIIFT